MRRCIWSPPEHSARGSGFFPYWLGIILAITSIILIIGASFRPKNYAGLYGTRLGHNRQRPRRTRRGLALKFHKEIIRQASDNAFDSLENSSQSIKKILSIADRIVPGHFSEFVREGDHFTWEEPAQMNRLIR